MSNALSVLGLNVQYGSDLILKNLSFQIKKGEIVAIVGKSGSGKTTLLHVLAGLKSFSGKVELKETPGLVFQKYAIYPWLTVAQNIAFGMKAGEDPEQFLQLSGLHEMQNRYPAELSGGQRQRAALAMVLAHNASLLLMDEPYGALDAYTKSKMHEWLLEVQEKSGKTILFVTHDIEEALFLADRVLVLDDGRIIEEFLVPFKRPRHKDIKFSAEFGNSRKKLSELLVE
ncbi:ABC transporter ATP-binding protein [Patescibacteria group bacterium]|nr:ABC transporter ATP-binding protein [Patescibacteria group bacterium]